MMKSRILRRSLEDLVKECYVGSGKEAFHFPPQAILLQGFQGERPKDLGVLEEKSI